MDKEAAKYLKTLLETMRPEEIAVSTGYGVDHIRKILAGKRQPSPRMWAELKRLSGQPALANTSSEAEITKPAEPASNIAAAAKTVHEIEAGPMTMQRLGRIQALAEDNRTTLLNLKAQVDQIVELLAQFSDERIKRKRA